MISYAPILPIVRLHLKKTKKTNKKKQNKKLFQSEIKPSNKPDLYLSVFPHVPYSAWGESSVTFSKDNFSLIKFSWRIMDGFHLKPLRSRLLAHSLEVYDLQSKNQVVTWCCKAPNPILFYMALYILYGIVYTVSHGLLQSPIVSYSLLQSPIVSCSLLQSPIVSYSLPQSPKVSYSLLQSPIVSYSLLQSPTVSHSLLQSPIVSRSLPQSPTVSHSL